MKTDDEQDDLQQTDAEEADSEQTNNEQSTRDSSIVPTANEAQPAQPATPSDTPLTDLDLLSAPQPDPSGPPPPYSAEPSAPSTTSPDAPPKPPKCPVSPAAEPGAIGPSTDQPSTVKACSAPGHDAPDFTAPPSIDSKTLEAINVLLNALTKGILRQHAEVTDLLMTCTPRQVWPLRRLQSHLRLVALRLAEPENPAGFRAGIRLEDIMGGLMACQSLTIRALVNAAKTGGASGPTGGADTRAAKRTAPVPEEDDFDMLIESISILTAHTAADGDVCAAKKHPKTAATPRKGKLSATLKGAVAEEMGASAGPEKGANSTPAKRTASGSESGTTRTLGKGTASALEKATAPALEKSTPSVGEKRRTPAQRKKKRR